MTTSCEKLPCADHQRVFYSVAGFYCLVCLTMIGYMVANDRRAQAAEVQIVTDLGAAKITALQQHADIIDKFSTRLDHMNSDLVQRLSRIEAKIESK